MRPDKIGICEWSLPVDGPYSCKLAKELGFTGIQLDIGPYERDFSKSKRYVQDAYLEASQEYGIQYPSMATRVSDYYCMTDEPGTKEHEIVKDGIMRAVEACGYMKIPLILIPNFEKSYISNERHFEIVCDVMKEACDRAAKYDIRIAAENTLSIEKTEELFSLVNRDNFGLYFDIQNYFLSNDAYTPDVLRALYKYVEEVHVKDGKGKDLSGALLGTGDAGFYENISVLKENNYDGWLVSENYYDMQPLCKPGDDPVEILRKDIEIIKKAIK